MGRVDPAPPRSGRGPFSLAGWIAAGALGVVLAVVLALQVEARAGAETALVLNCPACYAASHRLEVGLSWPPPDGRQ